jgi:hypothetical protein
MTSTSPCVLRNRSHRVERPWSAQNVEGMTAVHRAASSNNTAVLETLIEIKGDIVLPDKVSAHARPHVAPGALTMGAMCFRVTASLNRW